MTWNGPILEWHKLQPTQYKVDNLSNLNTIKEIEFVGFKLAKKISACLDGLTEKCYQILQNN